jgi:hypothetical protein
VQQPDHLSDGWRLVAERYAPGGQAGSSVNADPGLPSSASSSDIVRHAIDRKRGEFAHIVLGYEGPDELYLVLFERAAQPAEALPAGAARSVNDHPASLVQVAGSTTLTWVADGTWTELESNLPENELMSSAARLIVSQSPSPDSAVSTPLPLVITSHVIPPVSLKEAQAQVSFHIPTFEVVPAGFELGGAHVDPPNWAQIYYVPTDPKLADIHAGFGVGITLGVPTQTDYLGGTERQPDLLVNGQPAEYWSAPSLGSLEWEADGFTYELTFSGFELSPDALQRLAESLR